MVLILQIQKMKYMQYIVTDIQVLPMITPLLQ